MDCKIVYEVTNDPMMKTWLLSALFMLFGFGITLFAYKFHDKRTTRRKFQIGFGLVFGGLSTIFTAIIAPHQIHGYYATQERYRRSDFKKVSGKVSGFSPMPRSGHAYESFTVQGVRFSYSDFDESYYGFNNTKSHGGPIREDGQRVRIAYHPTDQRNVILKLELCQTGKTKGAKAGAPKRGARSGGRLSAPGRATSRRWSQADQIRRYWWRP